MLNAADKGSQLRTTSRTPRQPAPGALARRSSFGLLDPRAAVRIEGSVTGVARAVDGASEAGAALLVDPVSGDHLL
jgi:hypothetical protein